MSLRRRQLAAEQTAHPMSGPRRRPHALPGSFVTHGDFSQMTHTNCSPIFPARFKRWHTLAASVAYRVTVAWMTNRVRGACRRLRNTGSPGDRPDDSARSDVMVVGQSGQCLVLPPLPTSRTEPDPSERTFRSPMTTAAASLARAPVL